jgi:hypothetical protein
MEVEMAQDVVAATKRRRRRVTVKNDPWICELCLCETTSQKVKHHVQYGPPEITGEICCACHAALHWQGRVFNHPLSRALQIPQEERRALIPYYFAQLVVAFYQRKLAPSPDPLDARVRIIFRGKDSERTH